MEQSGREREGRRRLDLGFECISLSQGEALKYCPNSMYTGSLATLNFVLRSSDRLRRSAAAVSSTRSLHLVASSKLKIIKTDLY